MESKWQHPFSAIVAGPSGSGKSYFVVKFLENIDYMCDVKFANIYWHYSEWLPNINSGLNITFKEGLPDISEIDTSKPNLVIIDDLMREADGRVVDLFTRGCHHRNLSVFLLLKTYSIKVKGRETYHSMLII